MSGEEGRREISTLSITPDPTPLQAKVKQQLEEGGDGAGDSGAELFRHTAQILPQSSQAIYCPQKRRVQVLTPVQLETRCDTKLLRSSM